MYGNAFFSRFYYAYADKQKCGEWIAKMKLLWKDKDIVILSATEINGTLGGLATPLCEEVEERKFKFKMTHKEKKQYKKERKKKNLHDKKFYNRKNWGKDY